MLEDIIGSSPAMQKTRAEAIKAATNDLPVLLTGESGTGKELFAHAIQAALDDADGSRTKAARALGIHRTLLYRKMKKLEML